MVVGRIKITVKKWDVWMINREQRCFSFLGRREKEK
jgi:hypothetical protein